MRYIFQTIVLILSFSNLVDAQFEIPPKPSTSKQQPIYDYAGILTDSEFTSLSSKLKRYADTTSTQIVYAVIKSSNGMELDQLGAQWGQKWGIGQEDEDNGVLLILAVEDRQVDINTGYGIESRLSDLDAERIVNRVLIPNFKNKNYYAGLDQGADAIFQGLEGEFTGTPQSNNQIPWQFFIFFGFFLLIIIMQARNKNDGNRNGGSRNGGSLLDVIILSNMGRGGFGGGFGGSSSGGGFGGGFGGGGFGGGGAGGSW
ncbi:uncharacterized protein LX97_02382 [Nonlabens dokdonensis]|jgi:uncharacterized protein|uniref:Membrane protein containing DUF477 n=2 Tax=Nonlabens dokdonensis TaxID=328515 RepID=L7W570_NONDD|nr:TPM domain-containing protein [Nonlabens dokdonensis]AGC75244.1 membrane protein containing DUF477 [Nonlabens dokdonensis DSW-6]PZX39016.1 uncharacterized protein LX97_02382 [Nonlabens dokdonensis]